MEKEFVPYEAALRLKALGFDKHCFGVFYSSEDKVVKVLPSDVFNEKAFIEKGFLKAPTFSQAFRWFREKHGLESSIMFHESYFYKGKKNIYESTIEQRDGETYLLTPIEGFSTYKEAELACLDKLLEIVEGIES